MSGEWYAASEIAAQENRRRRRGFQQRQIAEANMANPNALPDLSKLDGIETVPFDPTGADVPGTGAELPKWKRLFHALQMPFKYAADGASRVQQSGREVAMFAKGKTTIEGFRRRYVGAFKGTVRMTSDEFLHIMAGSENFHRWKNTPLIPGWFGDVVEPEQAMLGGKRRPKVSVASAVGLLGDIAVDPFNVLALTPVGAGVKMGKIFTKLRPPFIPRTWGLNQLFGPESNSPFAAWNIFRQPENMLPDQIYAELTLAKDMTEKYAQFKMKNIQDVFEASASKIKYRGDDDQLLATWLHGLKIGRDGTLSEAKSAVKLPKHLANIAGDIKRELDTTIDELVQAGHLTKDDLKRGAFASFFPKLIGRSNIPKDIWQSWNQHTIGIINWAYKDDRKLGAGIKLKDVSAIDSIHDFIYGAARKLQMQPTLRKYAPRPSGEEHAITKNMSRWQRRYYTNLANEFTGDNRGRLQLHMELAMDEYAQKVFSTPFGQRILDVTTRIRGRPQSGTAVPEFSVGTVIAQNWTHAIIRATLGGRLKSTMQNLTQVMNFGIAKGVPATIRGMFAIGSPTKHGKTLRALRAEQDLNKQFRAMWYEGSPISKLDNMIDESLMYTFNKAETFIRGVGYNVGLDDYLKKNKFKNLDAALAAGKKAEMMKYALLESNKGAFTYGVLGRSPSLSHPVTRIGTTLMSYPAKQVEFLNRAFRDDPSSFLRFIGIHGSMIRLANEEVGVAAEDFLGFGFTPMTKTFGGVPTITSPVSQAMLDLIQTFGHASDGNYVEADKALKRFFRIEKYEVKDGIEIPIPVGSAVTAINLAKVPWAGINDITKLMHQLNTKKQTLGEGFAWISTEESITNYLISRSTTQKMRAQLKEKKRRALYATNFELNRRAKKFAMAALGKSGDDLGKAAWEAAQPIVIEGQNFYPTPEQINDRINALIEKKIISEDLLALNDSGFLAELFIKAQLELFARATP